MLNIQNLTLRNGRLLIRDTGVEIPLHKDFWVDVLRSAHFILLVQLVQLWQRKNPQRALIHFFPVTPQSYYAIWPICRLAQIGITNNPQEADLLFFFQDTAFGTVSPPVSGKTVLNQACTDIRKSRVAEVFAQVFRYPLALDPLTHVGEAVEKSEGNGVHDGRIVQCPLPNRCDGMVYQHLIDNRRDKGLHLDIRTPIVGGRLPFVYLKLRESAQRFANTNWRVELAEADALFSPQEQAQLLTFARAMGLDFGGLDVLRDRHNGRIYVVDVNKTDMGPPIALSLRARLQAIRRLAEAFVAEFVKSA